jgi:hypothetical protein
VFDGSMVRPVERAADSRRIKMGWKLWRILYSVMLDCVLAIPVESAIAMVASADSGLLRSPSPSSS